MGVVSHQLLREHLNMDVCVIELLAHLPELAHGIVKVALSFAPTGTGVKGKHLTKRTSAQSSLVLLHYAQ